MAMKRTTLGEFAMADIIIFPYFRPGCPCTDVQKGGRDRASGAQTVSK